MLHQHFLMCFVFVVPSYELLREFDNPLSTMVRVLCQSSGQTLLLKC